MKTSFPFLLFSLSLPATWAIQPDAAPAQPAPLRDLEFGDINFLHTTDTHGWHAGHLLEPSFSADWGDYVSFSEHLRINLEAEGKDLLVVDTGDRIEGNGLYDSSSPRGVYTFPIFEHQQIDLICVGNHELYKNSSAEDDYNKLVPHYKSHYIASNLRIIDPQTGQEVQLASRYRLFTTKKKGIRILAFGFIFDFNRNDKNTVVERVEDTIRAPWFTEAVASNEVDLIVVIGHVALRSFEFENVHTAIRQMKPDVPIQFFGGHYHVRDYRVFDQKAHALASGRFMETVGFQSITDLASSAPKFFRSYIDNNLYSFYHHSKTNSTSFITEKGRITTEAITRARSTLDLDETFGCADQTYWMSRVPYPHSSSIYTLLTDSILPDMLNLNPDRRNKTRLLLTNTGAIRFDIFAGPFTRDSTFIVSPFTSNLSYIANVPYKLAKQLLPILNGGDPVTIEKLFITTYNQKQKIPLDALPPREQAERMSLRQRFPHLQDEKDPRAILNGQVNKHHNDGSEFYESEAEDDDYLNKHIGPREAVQQPLDKPTTETFIKPSINLVPGYTTFDDLGTTGDDTIHLPITFYDVPNTIQSLIPGPNSTIPPDDIYTIPLDASNRNRIPVPQAEAATLSDDEPVDVVFNHFLAPYIIHILNILPYILEETSSKPLHEKVHVYDYEVYRDNLFWMYTDEEDEPACVARGMCPYEYAPDYIRKIVDAERDEETSRAIWDAIRAAGGQEAVDIYKYYDDMYPDRDAVADAFVARTKKYTEDDVENYVPGETFTTLLAQWVARNWKENCEWGGLETTREYRGGEL